MKWVYLIALLFVVRTTTAGTDFNGQQCVADIALVLDSSSSIWFYYFKEMQQAVADVVEMLTMGPDDVQVAGLFFSDIIDGEFHFGEFNQTETIDHILKYKQRQGGSTRTYKALKAMRSDLFGTSKGAREHATKVAIVVTDGETNPGFADTYTMQEAKAKTRMEAETAKMDGIYIFAVGIGSDVDNTEINDIASDPDSKFSKQLRRFSQVKGELTELLRKKACSLKPKPAPPTDMPADETRKECQGKEADVIFVMDQSTSIESTTIFESEKKFVIDIIDKVYMDGGKTRVGVNGFSDESIIEIRLGGYQTKAELQQLVRDIPWRTGNTMTNYALEDLMVQFKEHGREGVAKIGVFITDGVSTDPYQTKARAQDVKDSGIFMIAVGAGVSYDKSELELIATQDPDSSVQTVFTVDNLATLDTIKNKVSYGVCAAEKKSSDRKPMDFDKEISELMRLLRGSLHTKEQMDTNE